MEAQNGAHGCDCGKVKVTLLNKRNAAEALTAPLNGKAIAVRGQHLLKGAVLFIYKIYLTCSGSGSPKMSAVLS